MKNTAKVRAEARKTRETETYPGDPVTVMRIAPGERFITRIDRACDRMKMSREQFFISAARNMALELEVCGSVVIPFLDFDAGETLPAECREIFLSGRGVFVDTSVKFAGAPDIPVWAGSVSVSPRERKLRECIEAQVAEFRSFLELALTCAEEEIHDSRATGTHGDVIEARFQEVQSRKAYRAKFVGHSGRR